MLIYTTETAKILIIMEVTDEMQLLKIFARIGSIGKPVNQ